MIKSSYISRNRKPIFFDARTWWGMSQSAFSISLGTARTHHGMLQCSWNFCEISNIKLNINPKPDDIFSVRCSRGFVSFLCHWHEQLATFHPGEQHLYQTNKRQRREISAESFYHLTSPHKRAPGQLFFSSGPEALYHSGPAKSGIRYDEAANPWEFSTENGQGRGLQSSASLWMENFLRSFGQVWKWDPCFWHVLLQRKNHLTYLKIIFGWCVQSESYYHFTSKFPENETNICIYIYI